jgi:hypothetical protein
MFEQMLKNMLTGVLANDKNPTKKFEDFLNERGWPQSYSKESLRKSINLLISEELPDDPSGELIDLILGQTRTTKKTTAKQRKIFKNILTLTDSTTTRGCDHTLGIAPFIYGGGFTPIQSMPEVICTKCGLNVTLFKPRDVKKFEEKYGIKVVAEIFEEVVTWASTCKGVELSDDILGDPIGMYIKSKNKWGGEFPFKIVNKVKFESMSGK